MLRLSKLKLPGGVLLGTTAEHSFWVVDKGWVPALELHAGNVLIGSDGHQTRVAGIEDELRYIAAHNFRWRIGLSSSNVSE